MKVSLLLRNVPFELERALCSRLNKALGLRPSSAPFLSGDTYRAMADAVFDETGEFDPTRVKPGSVVFVGVRRLREFETRALPALKSPVVLISHQGDVTVDASSLGLAEDPRILHWFAQNCVVDHPKITPLPIGLEDRWRHNNGEISDFKKLRRNVPSRPRISYAFSLHTNLEKRIECYRRLKASDLADELEQPLNSSLYRRAAREYMFIASPPGNGPDCHRTWEAMYMNCVPIVEDCSMNRHFKEQGFPLLIVGDWDELRRWDETSLARAYVECRGGKACEKLYSGYWNELFRLRARSGDEA